MPKKRFVTLTLDDHDFQRLRYQARRNHLTPEAQADVYVLLSLEDDEQREEAEDE